MHRFYINQPLDKEILMVKDRLLAHQMKNVLKLHKGEKVVFFSDQNDFAGYDYTAELKNIDGAAAVFMLREKIENIRESSKKLVLYQSLIKKDKFELVLEKATEVGVSEIVPVISARSEKKSLNVARCRLILKEAAEQSGRAVIPTMHDVVFFNKAVEKAQESSAKIFFAYEDEKDNMIHGVGDRVLNLFIGPEGGWEEKEIAAVHRTNFEIVSLGRLILRSETAAIVASYTLLWG